MGIGTLQMQEVTEAIAKARRETQALVEESRRIALSDGSEGRRGMSGKEILSLDEFVTAPRKAGPPRPASAAVDRQSVDDVAQRRGGRHAIRQIETTNVQETRTDARKALRRLKRERVKGVQNFVNVHLDRETKKRLKLASFTSEVSMQSLMETAIRKFLDDNGF